MKRNGFTLIELLVSTALFVVIVSLVSTIFATSLRSQQGIVQLIAANDNLFLTLEQMAREMRVGRAFSLSGTQINFTTPRGDTVSYRFVNEGIERSVNTGAFRKITADNVRIVNANTILTGQVVGDGLPTRVTIGLSVGAKGVSSVENITSNIQTTITVRNLDN